MTHKWRELSVMQDDETGLYFVAGSTGPRSWRYHDRKWRAIVELWHWRWDDDAFWPLIVFSIITIVAFYIFFIYVA